jgi:hypothetical protein
MKRVTHKTERTPEQTAELRAIREQYQRTKPTPDEALAASGHAEFRTLGEVLLLHQVFSLLKQERERQGLTLAQVSERAGIDAAALSRLERGEAANPTLGTVCRISAALGKAIGCQLEDLPPTKG